MLSHGGLQEEILFVTHPELLPSILLFENLSPTETAFFTNIQLHSQYKNYGKNFEYNGPDRTLGLSNILAMDAIEYPNDLD